MLELGRSSPLDKLKVDVRVAALAQQRSKAEMDRELIALHLAILLGRSSHEPFPRVPDKFDLSWFPQMDSLSAAAKALTARSEIMALQKETARRKAELAQIRGERWPNVNAYGRWTGRSGLTLENSEELSDRDFLGLGLAVNLPLWTGGEIKARERRAKALLNEARAREQALRLQVLEQVKRETAAFLEAVERAEVGRKGVAQAREAFSIEKANFELGRAAVNDVLDAQAELLNAELALVRALHDKAFAAVNLAWATGEDLEKLVLESRNTEQ